MLPSITFFTATISCLSVARAHIALWDKGMYGLNYPYQASDTLNHNYNNDAPVRPLREADALTVDQWFGHGYKGYPPKDGDFMVLPAGGVYTGEVACNRAETTLRDPARTDALFKYACSGDTGYNALHVALTYDSPYDASKFGGSVLSIAYTSDVNSLQPNDLTVISVVQQSVWTREISYSIPAGLPACPPGGCICAWSWNHQTGAGYPFEIFNLLYRCTVTGATGTAPVRRGQVPKDCTGNPSACVSGPKTPMYLYQVNGNNMPHMDSPPLYNDNWGFKEGAQNDIFQVASTPAPTTYLLNAYATPTATTGNAATPTCSTNALPAGWEALGCVVDQNARTFNTQVYSGSGLTIGSCISMCDYRGYKYGGVENGQECWCSDSATITTAPPSECNSRCGGDQWCANCGGSWRLQGYIKVNYDAQLNSSSSSTSYTQPANANVALPSGWTDQGCYQDQSSTRTLKGTSFSTSSMTIVDAINYCASKGYSWTGLENGNEAWCGSPAVTLQPVNGCNVPCSGNKDNMCGGSWKINLYRNNNGVGTTTTAATTTTTPAAPTTTPAPTTTTTPATAATPSFVALGCFMDQSPRTLSYGPDTLTNNTPLICAQYCQKLGYTLSGTSYSHQCMCGNSANLVKAEGCVNTCSGDSSQICGGTWRINVMQYQTPATTTTTTTTTTTPATTTTTTTTASPSPSPASALPAGWTDQGCVMDQNPRTLSGGTVNLANNTPANCIAWCVSKGFKYCGTQYSNQCYGANTIGTITQASGCTSLCAGDNKLMCGGSWRLNLYRNDGTTPTTTTTTTTTTPAPTTTTTTTTTPAPPAATTQANGLPISITNFGCYADRSDRIFPEYSTTSNILTPLWCYNTCASRGFSYFGLQYQSQCWCSNSIAKIYAKSTNCNTKCTGDNSVTCGGSWEMEVYGNAEKGKPAFKRRSRI